VATTEGATTTQTSGNIDRKKVKFRCTDHWDPDYANTTSSKYLERKKKIFD
ncbi:hypothetical protein NDU88_007600, partial [Pleurodeles waltl]